MFVIRDFTDRENIDYIEKILKTDIEKMWSEIKKPEQHKDLAYTDVFSVEVFTLSHYVYKKDDFLKDIKVLR